jgi:hypothetical protein
MLLARPLLQNGKGLFVFIEAFTVGKSSTFSLVKAFLLQQRDILEKNLLYRRTY